MAQQIDLQSNNIRLKSTSELKLNCSGCTRPFTKEQLDQRFATFPMTQQSLLKFYIKRNDEYQTCPSSNCNNIGWTSQDCKNLTCNQCNINWDSGLNIPNSLKKFSFSELFTKLFKIFLTKNCPQCTAPIYKVGGCKKIKCINCDKLFCWKCKQLGHYTFSLYCFLICLFNCLLVVLPFNYLLYYYGVYDPAINQLKEFFTVENFFYQYGFIYVFSFLFRLIYKNGLAILIPLNIFERNNTIIWRILTAVDIILWFIFTRWMEVAYYLLITPQIVFSLILFFD
ncbi:Ibr domain protein (macronuclear) [Tetrahymena thermophila SB210]|uniref:Ibr domain protein n=1 Tax=Tetrahymena thermophila (strain SB210) TaxID=312017 RepID=Q23F37_TETTS|nr:Ibr domain protein [Tetrahymena thermophila SB210]EAR95068.2 Ibr domain protein [Tetrahymena thermophila SB210]|eukprot:XP_001015313.2 Ibr domain protein [Tetrahymena thermophila SB210]